MESCVLMGIVVDKRQQNAPHLQEVLTEYGYLIKMRLGLHDRSEERR